MVRSNLQKSTRANIYQGFGATVACIFMFCDIRGFTDSSECLNEEVFVFTNRIAAVVHSYCHAYGGSANKVSST
jgi:class 3 adenylate cyclase